MKPTAKQKRNNLIASFGVIAAGAIALTAVSAWNEPLRALRRELSGAGYTVRSERNVDAGEYSYISAETDGIRVGDERVLVFGFATFDDAAAAENEFWETYGEDCGAGTYLTDRYLLVYTGPDAALRSVLEKNTL